MTTCPIDTAGPELAEATDAPEPVPARSCRDDAATIVLDALRSAKDGYHDDCDHCDGIVAALVDRLTPLIEELRLKRFLLTEEQTTIATHVEACERHGYDEDTAKPIASWLHERLEVLERVQSSAQRMLGAVVGEAGDLGLLAYHLDQLREACRFAGPLPPRRLGVHEIDTEEPTP